MSHRVAVFCIEMLLCSVSALVRRLRANMAALGRKSMLVIKVVGGSSSIRKVILNVELPEQFNYRTARRPLLDLQYF